MYDFGKLLSLPLGWPNPSPPWPLPCCPCPIPLLSVSWPHPIICASRLATHAPPLPCRPHPVFSLPLFLSLPLHPLPPHVQALIKRQNKYAKQLEKEAQAQFIEAVKEQAEQAKGAKQEVPHPLSQ